MTTPYKGGDSSYQANDAAISSQGNDVPAGLHAAVNEAYGPESRVAQATQPRSTRADGGGEDSLAIGPIGEKTAAPANKAGAPAEYSFIAGENAKEVSSGKDSGFAKNIWEKLGGRHSDSDTPKKYEYLSNRIEGEEVRVATPDEAAIKKAFGGSLKPNAQDGNKLASGQGEAEVTQPILTPDGKISPFALKQLDALRGEPDDPQHKGHLSNRLFDDGESMRVLTPKELKGVEKEHESPYLSPRESLHAVTPD